MILTLSSSWAKIGALVTVFSLASDPNFQVLIKTDQRIPFQDSPGVTAKRAASFEFNLPNGDSKPSSLGPLALIKIPIIDTSQDTTFVETANICAFNLCAREYKVTVSNGVPQSEVIGTSYSNLTSQDDLNNQHSSSYIFKFPVHRNHFPFDAEPVNNENTGNFETGLNKYLADVFTGNITKYQNDTIAKSTNMLPIWIECLYQYHNDRKCFSGLGNYFLADFRLMG